MHGETDISKEDYEILCKYKNQELFKGLSIKKLELSNTILHPTVDEIANFRTSTKALTQTGIKKVSRHILRAGKSAVYAASRLSVYCSRPTKESPSCPPENRPSGTRKKQASFPFHSGNPTTFSSIFNFQFSDSMTSASVSASKPLLPLFHSAIPSKPYKPSLFPVFPVFFEIGEVAWEGLGMGYVLG